MAALLDEDDQNRSTQAILAEEKDYSLLTARWPTSTGRFQRKMTTQGGSYLTRKLRWWLPSSNGPSDADVEMLEAIVRFPSAPVYTIHRKREYQYPMPERLNFHTLRLLRRPFRGRPSQISRIYILHNGLNELEDLGLYYEVAARLLKDDVSAACIIRPFPGHLTRNPFPQDYGEKPLDRYLLDAGDLFRQFLRFMLETQWLFSILVPLTSYRVVAGLDLLREGNRPSDGRHREAVVARAIRDAWRRAFHANQFHGDEATGKTVTLREVKSVGRTLRYLVGWKGGVYREAPRLPPSRRDVLRPALHVVGYSLGGFVAQSVFFTWPFAVASCATICSGGAMREVVLKAFAHSEEWQTVMHALRYEMANAMIEHRLRREGGHIAGIDVGYFGAFYKIFHAVFLQDFRGSYRSRVAEYLNRLFFVVGGDDPIIPIRSVLETSPREGLNLLEVARMGHFVGRRGEWEDFWLPQVTRVERQFAERCEELLWQTLNQNWWNEERTEWWDGKNFVDRVSEQGAEQTEMRGVGRRRVPFAREMDPVTKSEALTSLDFQEELQQMVDGLPGVWLFILRNDVPTALIGPRLLHRRGTPLHHSDEAIRHYISGLNVRRDRMKDNPQSVTLVVPSALRHWFARRQPVFSGKVEAAAFRVPSAAELHRIWKDFYRDWSARKSLWLFDPAGQQGIAPADKIEQEVRKQIRFKALNYPVVNTLPDVWIAFRGEAHSALSERGDGLYVERFLSWVFDLVRRDHAEAERQLGEWLENEDLRVVKVSSAEFNPRFMGWRVRDPKRVLPILTHSALAFRHSEKAT